MKTTHRSGSDDGKNGTRYGPATVEELATVLEMTRRGAQEKATREGWLSKEGARGRGKAGQCDLEVLPGEIRDAILVHRNRGLRCDLRWIC